MQNSEG